MKRIVRFRVFLIAALLLFPTLASAAPDFATYVEYFDENGQQVGWRVYGCTGTYGSGGPLTNYTTLVIGDSCDTGQPAEVTCEDMDQPEASCGICMSYEYEALYLQQIAPDPCAE